MEALGKLVFIVVAIVIIQYLVDKYMAYDDTDDKENKERSGLVLYTDYKTGIQYVKGGLFGSITPRLDEHGTPMKAKGYEND